MSLPRIIDRCPAWSSVVVTADQIAMASAADCRVYVRPAGLLTFPAAFLSLAHDTMAKPAEATMAVPEWPHAELPDVQPWRYRTVATGSPWSTYVHDVTGETLHLVDLGQLAAADPSAWLLGHDAAALAVKLAAFHHATGTAYRSTPGVTGCAIIRRLADEAAARKPNRGNGTPPGQPFWRFDRHPMHLAPMGDLRWTTDTMPASGYVEQFDARAAYLAAASAARLAWSPLSHTGPRLFDKATAGYWQINAADVPASFHAGRPWVIDPGKIDTDGTVWLTTPVMDYLNGWGINPDVVDSWTCEQAGTLLRPWAESIRDGLAAATDPDVADTLKETYRQTLGMLNRPGGSIHRPDWWATVVDLARMNLLRKIDKAYKATGVYPVRIYTDAVHYWHETGAQRAALAALLDVDPAGRKIGKLRDVGGMTAAAFTAKYSRPARPARRRAGAR